MIVRFGTREKLPWFARQELPTQSVAPPQAVGGTWLAPVSIRQESAYCRAANGEVKGESERLYGLVVLGDLPLGTLMHAFGLDDTAPCPAARRVLSGGNSNQAPRGNSSRAPKGIVH